MIIKTERLILRPWQESDALECFKYATDPNVGPEAGWKVHTSLENTLDIIKNGLMVDETYAICLKETNLPIGSIGLNDRSDNKDYYEKELGFWIGAPHFRKGYGYEAAVAIIRHAFCDLRVDRLICKYFEGNLKSQKLQEKLGFKFIEKIESFNKGKGINTHSYVNMMTRLEWIDKYSNISYCGLDCNKCEAFLATISNDKKLREEVALKWSKLNNVTILPSDINCMGCTGDGVKTRFCDSLCEIRKCAIGNNYVNCGKCSDLDTCPKIKMIISNNKDALNRLKNN